MNQRRDDELKVSTKVVCVLAGLLATGAVAMLPAVLGAPTWSAVLAVLVVAVGVTVWARSVFLGGTAFELIGYGSRLNMARATTAATTVHVLWALLAPHDLWTWQWAAGLLVGLGALEWALAAWWDYQVTHVKPRAQIAVPDRHLPALELDEVPPTAAGLMHEVLRQLGKDHYDQVADGALGYGGWWELQMLTPMQAAERAAKAEHASDPTKPFPKLKIKDLTPLTSADCESIATTIQSLTGVEMMTDWVQVTSKRAAGRVVVTVTTEDVMAKAIPYTALDDTPRPRNEMAIGLDVRGEPVTVDPCQHWVIVGATGSGKSALENVVIGEGLVRGEVWVCGAEKVWALMEDWVDLLGADDEVRIWAVQGMDDTLKMMAAAMDVARYRQGLSAAQKGDLTPLWVVMTESPRVLMDKTMQITWEGRKYFASELTAHGGRSTLSAQVYWVWSAQDYDHEMFGDQAASIKKNSDLTVIVRSRNPDERRRAFGDSFYGLPDLYNRGEAYVQNGRTPVHAKLFYPQESDPAKPLLHDGPTIQEIAKVRAGQRGGLDAGSARAAGVMYAERPLRMTAAHRDYLRGVGQRAPVVRDPEAEAAAQVDAFLAQVMPKAKALPAAPPAAELPAPVVGPVVPDLTWGDRIIQLVTDAGGRMRRKDIRAGLVAAGAEPSEGVLNNVLGDLKLAGRLKNPTIGLYELPHLTDLTSPTPSPVSAGGGQGGGVR